MANIFYNEEVLLDDFHLEHSVVSAVNDQLPFHVQLVLSSKSWDSMLGNIIYSQAGTNQSFGEHEDNLDAPGTHKGVNQSDAAPGAHAALHWGETYDDVTGARTDEGDNPQYFHIDPVTKEHGNPRRFLKPNFDFNLIASGTDPENNNWTRETYGAGADFDYDTVGFTDAEADGLLTDAHNIITDVTMLDDTSTPADKPTLHTDTYGAVNDEERAYLTIIRMVNAWMNAADEDAHLTAQENLSPGNLISTNLYTASAGAGGYTDTFYYSDLPIRNGAANFHYDPLASYPASLPSDYSHEVKDTETNQYGTVGSVAAGWKAMLRVMDGATAPSQVRHEDYRLPQGIKERIVDELGAANLLEPAVAPECKTLTATNIRSQGPDDDGNLMSSLNIERVHFHVTYKFRIKYQIQEGDDDADEVVADGSGNDADEDINAMNGIFINLKLSKRLKYANIISSSVPIRKAGTVDGQQYADTNLVEEDTLLLRCVIPTVDLAAAASAEGGDED